MLRLNNDNHYQINKDAEDNMARRCFLLKVKNGKLQEYLDAHRAVWPEVLDALKACGVKNYSMFHNRDGLLVGYMEGDDISRTMKHLRDLDIYARWSKFMAQFFDGPPNEHVFIMDEYFHLES